MEIANKYACIVYSKEMRLITASFLMLFIELVLIRWIGSNVIYLSYFSNFILLGSFLGIGIGFLRAKNKTEIFYLSPILLAFFVFFVYLFPLTINRSGDDLIFFGAIFKNDFLLPSWFYLPIIFVMVTIIMASIGDGVSRLFYQFSPLSAYRLDIIGSIAGILTFAACAFLNCAPIYWAIIICLAFTYLLHREWSFKNFESYSQISCLLLLIFIFSSEAINKTNFWSPYYKISMTQHDQNYNISVNGIPHQSIASVLYRQKFESHYFAPYGHLAKDFLLKNVLIIGAGTGGDVAIALSKGAEHIDAVEIDPLLFQLGKIFNPNRPYQDSRVNVYINDGRAFLQNSQQLYDLIIFALPDSLTLISGQSSLRLENYLFTIEAMYTMKQHLKPNGLFAMYNYYRERWLVDRLANMLTIVFDRAPCIETKGQYHNWLSVLTDSSGGMLANCEVKWTPDPNNIRYILPATDDHPFIYLKTNHLPNIYLLSLSLICLLSIIALKLTGVTYSLMKDYLDLFFMGAAFLLLETKNIINFALLFGTTWFVNVLVFVGILLTVYLSIEISNSYKTFNPKILYILLFISLFASWILPNSYLLFLPPFLRFLSATVLAFTPIFIANLLFSARFKSTAHSTVAFGANLIGAMLGGMIEYISLIFGYQNLLIVVAFLYFLAVVIMSLQNSNKTTMTI